MDFKNQLPSKSKLTTKNAIIIALFSITIWLSAKQPFIPSEALLALLLWGGAPLFTFVFIYHTFLQKDKNTGLTIYKTKVAELNTQTKRFAWHIAVGPIMIGVSILFSMITQWYPAWPTKWLTEREATTIVYVNKVTFSRRVGMPRLYLSDINTNRTFKLLWTQDNTLTPIKTGDTLLMKSKQNWFGDYVISITTTPNKE